jgi:hypothetical protein
MAFSAFPRRLARLGATVCLVFAFAACGASGALKTALHGNLVELKRDVAAEQRAGKLDRGRVEDLARAVAGREVRSATGQAAVRRIREIRVCAGPLLPVLRERSERADDIGAEATLVLLEHGDLSPGAEVERHREASSGAWRAVAARAALSPRHGALRRAFLRDPDERVRRAALHAALAARDPADLEELLEAARLDPDPLSQGLATRAAGAVGGERAVLALKDLFAKADETARTTIVEAWSEPRSYTAGGGRELLRLSESGTGPPALAAASALVRRGAPSHAAVGKAVLIRAIRQGTTLERRLAIELAPLPDRAVLSSLDEAAKSEDLELRVLALTRLGDAPERREHARAALKKLAVKTGNSALQAQRALADFGDSSIAPKLAQQLRARHPAERREGALALVQLGDWSRAAPALADDDPDVRTAVACRVLAAR